MPAIQFAVTVLGYVASFWTAFPATGLTFLAVGAAYIALAAHARDALEAAAVATPDERRGRRGPATPPPELPQ